MQSTGNQTTDRLIGVQFTGNIIHQNWYKTILMDNGKPDAISIMILADIVYWYRPSEIRDETTGRTIKFHKKFKSDLLQRTYESFSLQMGFTKRQVQESIKRLETLGVITRIFRTVKFGDLVCYNVLYLKLNYDNLMAVTFNDVPSSVTMCHPTQEKISPRSAKSNTNTKTTPKIDTKIEATADSAVKDIDAVLILKNDKVLPPGIEKPLFEKLKAIHGVETVQKQLKNLKAEQGKRSIKNPSGWLTTAVNEGFDSKTEPNLFAIQENRDLELRLLEKLNSASNEISELEDQDFKTMLAQRPPWFLDMLAGVNVEK